MRTTVSTAYQTYLISWMCAEMASEMYLDALPYIDQGYEEPGVRESVSWASESTQQKA